MKFSLSHLLPFSLSLLRAAIVRFIGIEDGPHDCPDPLAEACDPIGQCPGCKLLEEVIAERDELYYDAVRYVLQYQRGSVSLLQRKLNIGYGRASRLIDFMAEDHVVGEYSGSQAREVMITPDEWQAISAMAGLT